MFGTIQMDVSVSIGVSEAVRSQNFVRFCALQTYMSLNPCSTVSVSRLRAEWRVPYFRTLLSIIYCGSLAFALFPFVPS